MGKHILIWPEGFPRDGVMVDFGLHPTQFRFIRLKDRSTWDALRGLHEPVVLDPFYECLGELADFVSAYRGIVVTGLDECRAELLKDTPHD
ncbi:hypothetical protein [Ancylobacter sp.]|uniref:hypothetical protein n=1 Tax=Ancylobacter sp. TaxID=1872567 RepID=UPI003BACE2C1